MQLIARRTIRFIAKEISVHYRLLTLVDSCIRITIKRHVNCLDSIILQIDEHITNIIILCINIPEQKVGQPRFGRDLKYLMPSNIIWVHQEVQRQKIALMLSFYVIRTKFLTSLYMVTDLNRIFHLLNMLSRHRII